MVLPHSSKGDWGNSTQCLSKPGFVCLLCLLAFPLSVQNLQFLSFPTVLLDRQRVISGFIITVPPTGLYDPCGLLQFRIFCDCVTGRGQGKAAGGTGVARAALHQGSHRCCPPYIPSLQAGLISPATSVCVLWLLLRARGKGWAFPAWWEGSHRTPRARTRPYSFKIEWGFGVKLRAIFPRSLRVWRNNKRRAVDLFSRVWTLYCTDIYVHDVAVI